MPRAKLERTEGYPSITARKHWGKYAAGMATETLFVLGLTAIGLLLAAAAIAIWQ
jgi:hypothetical protein